MLETAVYPGTFDPITNGHLDIIHRASRLFKRVIVACAINSEKNTCFNLAERVKLVQESTRDLPNIVVLSLEGLLVDFCKQQKALVIIRGIRAVCDFDYEFQLAGMNRKLAGDIETVFLTPSENCSFISSTMVKQIADLRGDTSPFVPKPVLDAFRKKILTGTDSP